MRSLLTPVLLIIFFVSEVYGQADTLTKIIPDDYPVTDEMLIDTSSNDSSYPKKSGEIFSLEKAWFTNDTLKQTLVFELYTDYHRLNIYHFLNDDIPSELIKYMALFVSNNGFVPASYQQKKTSFNGFINSSTKINQSYFATKKGFKLGDRKDKAISIYGKPDNCSTSEGIEKCEWKFEGDYTELETQVRPKNKKPIAEDSFGYTVTMFFKSKKLLAIILSNEIP